MGNTGDSTGSCHCFQKSYLIRARLLTRKFHFYVECFAIRYPMAPDICLALMTDVYHTAVSGIELTYCVVSGHAAIGTKGNNDFILQGCFLVQLNPPVQLYLASKSFIYYFPQASLCSLSITGKHLPSQRSILLRAKYMSVRF